MMTAKVVTFDDPLVALAVWRLLIQQDTKDERYILLSSYCKMYSARELGCCQDHLFRSRAQIGNDSESPLVMACGESAYQRIIVVAPSLRSFAYSFTFTSSRVLQSELSRQFSLRCRVAELLTIGGGWACLQRETKALECTEKLLQCAVALSDENLVLKCKLFMGWALLWSGDLTKGVELFTALHEHATKTKNKAYQQQCLHALINAASNPTLQNRSLYRAAC